MITNEYPYTDFHELNADWLLDQMRTFESSLDNNFLNKLDIVTPEQFGADGIGGVADDAFTSAIEYMLENDKHILYLPGSYQITQPIHLVGMFNITIIGGEGYINADESQLDINIFNYLWIEWCRKVKLINININNTSTEPETYILYHGGILVDHSYDVLVENCTMTNTMGGIFAFNQTERCKILKNKITNDNQNIQSNSAILIYSARDCIADKNYIKGLYRDGTISVFGADSKDNIISNNKLISADGSLAINWLPQGITVDSGAENTKVYSNYVYRMFYGIDNKSDTKGTEIYNNKVIGCKIGIADRPGENLAISATYKCSIHNNSIGLVDLISSTGLADWLYLNEFYFVGILSDSRFGFDIQSNSIYMEGQCNQVTVGIVASSQTNVDTVYSCASEVSNNIVDFAGGKGTATAAIPGNSIGFLLNNTLRTIISNNIFRVYYIDSFYHMFNTRGSLDRVMMNSNMMIGFNTARHYFLTNSAATFTNCSQYGNSAPECDFNFPF